MTLDEMLSAIDDKKPNAPEDAIAAFEESIGQSLPADYRDFLVRCNGGNAGGYLVFPGPIGKVGLNNVGGFREESYFSLTDSRDNYQNEFETRIPRDLIWIGDDPGGNAFCLGIEGSRRGHVYFWDHECEPDPDSWDGSFENAENLDLLAKSFSAFVRKLSLAPKPTQSVTSNPLEDLARVRRQLLGGFIGAAIGVLMAIGFVRGRWFAAAAIGWFAGQFVAWIIGVVLERRAKNLGAAERATGDASTPEQPERAIGNASSPEQPSDTTIEQSLAAAGAADVTVNSFGMKFVWIPPGTFLMGSPKDEKYRSDWEVQHKVTLTRGFYMGVHLVTQEQWEGVMGKRHRWSKFRDQKNLPVDSVSWDDCQQFIKKLCEKDKRAYRLPSEAEWEYSCRAGTTTPFHFGERVSTDQVNFSGRDFQDGIFRGRTTPVGSFPANAFGLHDMHGNLHEWCQDRFGDYPQEDVIDPQGPEIGNNPQGPGTEDNRVLRGGCWFYPACACRSASRTNSSPGYGSDTSGFRICFFPSVTQGLVGTEQTAAEPKAAAAGDVGEKGSVGERCHERSEIG